MSNSRPQHIDWESVEARPLFDFGERVTFKALTGENAQILRVELAAGVLFPNPQDPDEMEVHSNEQISTVLSGRMRLNIDGEDFIVQGGQSIVIPPDVPHRAEVLEDTVMLEVFSAPMPLG